MYKLIKKRKCICIKSPDKNPLFKYMHVYFVEFDINFKKDNLDPHLPYFVNELKDDALINSNWFSTADFFKYFRIIKAN